MKPKNFPERVTKRRAEERYFMSATWHAGKKEIEFPVYHAAFRMTEIRTNVSEHGQALISGIYCDSEQNQMMGELDCYNMSAKLLASLYKEFEKEHNLIGLSDSAIQNYLDEHELSYPKLIQLSLPAVKIDGAIRITGESLIDYQIMLLGYRSL